jgi:hypothetical protein
VHAVRGRRPRRWPRRVFWVQNSGGGTETHRRGDLVVDSDWHISIIVFTVLDPNHPPEVDAARGRESGSVPRRSMGTALSSCERTHTAYRTGT